MKRTLPVIGGLLAALALLAVAGWLATHNPVVEHTSTGAYACAAPYDVVLNDASSTGGGEQQRPDDQQIEERCHNVAETHATLAVVAAGLGLLVVVATVVAARRRD